MDVTVEYVKMCEQAEEIQAMVHKKEFTNKDFFARVASDDIPDVWMPRIDQLIEMIDVDDQTHEKDKVTYLRDILAMQTKTTHENNSIGSMEQLTMMTVMRVNYGKVWNVKDKVWEQEQ